MTVLQGESKAAEDEELEAILAARVAEMQQADPEKPYPPCEDVVVNGLRQVIR